MLKFFRSIRQRLLNEGKTLSYLTYAIGEIVLVVLGILIALRINTWNNQRLERVEGEKLMASIHLEFEQNQELLGKVLVQHVSAVDAHKQLLDLMGARQAELDRHNLDSLIYVSLGADFYLPSRSTIEGIFQGNRMHLIPDPDLRNALLQWNRDMDRFIMYKTTQIDWQKDMTLPYLAKHSSFVQMDLYGQRSWGRKSTLKTDYPGMFQDIVFENMIDNNLWNIDFNKQQLEQIAIIQARIVELAGSKK